MPISASRSESTKSQSYTRRIHKRARKTRTTRGVTAIEAAKAHWGMLSGFDSGKSSPSPVFAPDIGTAVRLRRLVEPINSGSAQTLTYDSLGNLTSDGTNSYAWDAENRLITITYTGSNNNTAFTYNALGQCVKIVEKTNNVVTSTKQHIWCGNSRCEERASNGTTIQARFFPRGEQISGTNYYYTLDHLGSVREMTNSSGVAQAQYQWDSWGRKRAIAETVASDFGYAGMYQHARSGLNLAVFRAYMPSIGRWISRDPIAEEGGVNLYAYVDNNSLNQIDPLGLTCASDCWLQFIGLGGAGAAAVAGGLPLIDKPFKAGEATSKTSLFSQWFGSRWRTPFSLPAPTGFPPVMRGTPYFGRFLARWLPFIGVGVTTFSITQLINCLQNCPKIESGGDWYPPPFYWPGGGDDYTPPPPYTPGPNTVPWNPQHLPHTKDYRDKCA